MKDFIRNHPFGFFLSFSILLRGLSFGYSVIDHDESTYLVIANQLLKGATLYVDVWDTKPPGIFLIFAGLIALFGKSIFFIRFTTAIVIGISAYLLYALKFKLDGQRKSSIIAASVFIVFCSVYRFGMAANTEIYFGLFSISGLYLYLVRNRKFLAGLFWGLGYVVKYVIVFDIFSFWLAIAIIYLAKGNSIRISDLVKNYLLLISGFVLPFGLIVWYYWSQGLGDYFFEASFIIPSRYQSEIILSDVVNCIFDFHMKFLPFMLIFYVSVFDYYKRNQSISLSKLLPLIWFLFAFVSVIIPGKYFTHYYLQLAMPSAWVISNAFNTDRKWVIKLSKNIRYAWAFVLISFALIAINQSYFFLKEDKALVLKKEIEKELRPGATIYAGEKYQILYFLLDIDPPTKYIHPTLIINPSHIETLRINPDDEFRVIFQHEPQYLVYHNFIRNSVLSKELKSSYKEMEIHSNWHLYYYKRLSE